MTKQASDSNAAMAGLADKLRKVKGALSPEDAKVFSEFVKIAVAQAQELKVVRSAEVIGGNAAASDVYSKPRSTVTTMEDLDTITALDI